MLEGKGADLRWEGARVKEKENTAKWGCRGGKRGTVEGSHAKD